MKLFSVLLFTKVFHVLSSGYLARCVLFGVKSVILVRTCYSPVISPVFNSFPSKLAHGKVNL